MDLVDQLLAFEEGELNFEQTIDLFQELYDSGLAYMLNGTYERITDDLIDQGLIRTKKQKAV